MFKIMQVLISEINETRKMVIVYNSSINCDNRISKKEIKKMIRREKFIW